VSATIDLLLTMARRHEPGQAENYVDQVAVGIATAPGWHEWLWTLHLKQARAELALARGDLDLAASEATMCVDLDLEGSDQLAAEALALRDLIRGALPGDAVKRRFDNSELFSVSAG
jgi:hypothetical protein